MRLTNYMIILHILGLAKLEPQNASTSLNRRRYNETKKESMSYKNSKVSCHEQSMPPTQSGPTTIESVSTGPPSSDTKINPNRPPPNTTRTVTRQSSASAKNTLHPSVTNRSNSKGRMELRLKDEEGWSSDEDSGEQSALALDSMKKAEEIIGKYKNTLHRQTNLLSTMSWLVHTINEITKKPNKTIKRHKVKFENTKRAAEYNAKLLKHCKHNLTTLLKKEKGTMIQPGSEFRLASDIEPLFRHHKLWKKMKKIVEEGVDYPLEEVPNETIKQDLHEMIKRGNHQSAQIKSNEQSLLTNYAKEVEHGWMLPTTTESILKLQGAAVIPIGVVQQESITVEGERYTKRRTTHDASFPPPSGKSINERMMRELLEPCFYGHYLLRLLHAIHTMRFAHPAVVILLIKYDLDAAYRRLHVVARMAALAITILKNIAYILLRLPFGVANGPSDYCVISEPVIDLSNDLLRDKTWNPKQVYSPIRNNLDPPAIEHKDDTPFAKARPLFVPVPFAPAVVDGYIDDLITVAIQKEDWIERAQNAAPLAIHTVFRPTNHTDPLPRADAISERKLKGEGTPSEVKTILGWDVNTRKFKIYLPKLKATEWRNEITNILHLTTVPTKRLESTIGRLNHAGHIVPQGRYFLNRLRHLLAASKKFGAQALRESHRKDLEMWSTFLQKVSTSGIDINNITFTEPTHTAFSDACEHGLGGYCTNGLAWRYKLPDQNQVSFEFVVEKSH